MQVVHRYTVPHIALNNQVHKPTRRPVGEALRVAAILTACPLQTFRIPLTPDVIITD